MNDWLFWTAITMFIVALLSFYMEWRYKAKFLVLFSLPTVLLISLLVTGRPSAVDRVLDRGPWFWVHFGFILAGLAGFVTAVSSAIMYLCQSAQLKSKHPGAIFLKLPSLDTLDRIHFRALSYGVVLFSLGILAGFLWSRGLSGRGSIFHDPKVILSFITCFMYWVIVSLRGSSMRRGHKIASGTLAVFLLLFLTIAISYYAPSAFHQGL